MGRVEMARFRQLATACTDWLIHVNQNGDGSFKDSRSIHCVFEMGQAVVSLLKFGEMEKNQEASDSAVACGEWMLKHQIRSKDKNADGHWTTPEYGKNLIVIPDTIETLRGLLELYRYTRRSQYLRSAFRALEAVKRARPCTDQSRWVSGGGIRARVRMDYDMRTRKYSVCLHRIGDDAIWYLLAKLTGDRALLREFKLQCDEQMKYQASDGGFYESYYSEHHNNIMVAGARWSVYWAAYPYFYAYQEFKEQKYLDVIARSCRWLADRQEKDGAFHAWYFANGDVAYDRIDPTSPAVAIILWSKFMKVAGTRKYLPHCKRALSWLIQAGSDPQYSHRAPQLGVGSAERSGLFNTRSAAFTIRAYYDLADMVGRQDSVSCTPRDSHCKARR